MYYNIFIVLTELVSNYCNQIYSCGNHIYNVPEIGPQNSWYVVDLFILNIA